MIIFSIENGNVVCNIGENEKKIIGMVSKVETVRIDNNNVQDVSYQFDLELGEYVETGRITRYEPDPNAKSPLELKLTELNAACNAAILAGFTSDALGTTHTYSFDQEAQTNLGGIYSAILGGLITTPQNWRASGVPVSHTVDQLKMLFAHGLNHKNTKIARYQTLEAQAKLATPEELATIVW